MSRWNVYRIENRWVRATVSCLAFPPLLVGLFCLTVILAAIDATWWAAKEMVAQFAFTFNSAKWRDLLTDSWRAMTAQEAA